MRGRSARPSWLFCEVLLECVVEVPDLVVFNLALLWLSFWQDSAVRWRADGMLGVVSDECTRTVAESIEWWTVLVAVSSLNPILGIGILCRLCSCFRGVVFLVVLHVVWRTVG